MMCNSTQGAMEHVAAAFEAMMETDSDISHSPLYELVLKHLNDALVAYLGYSLYGVNDYIGAVKKGPI